MTFASFGISSIAWPSEALDDALDLAVQHGLRSIEVAPYSAFGDWNPSMEDVALLRRRLDDHGLNCSSLQGILFDVKDAALFTSDSSRTAMAAHLRKIAGLAGRLGAKACVFGAPRQRDPGELSAEAAREIAVRFFRAVGSAFADNGTALAIEANSQVYGCRFLTTTADAIEFVEEVSTVGIRLQIDTGTIFLEKEDPDVLTRAAPIAAHAHVSEPNLAPIGTTGVDHHTLAAAMAASGYTGSLSIEMRAGQDWVAAFASAVGLVRSIYNA